VSRLFDGSVAEGLDGLADAFHAEPAPGIDVERMVQRAWDVTAIRAEHERFLATWEREEEGHDTGGWAMSRLTLLGADWLQLLRTDPGLPAEHLPSGWPADRSARAYSARSSRLRPLADEWLRRLLVTDVRRR